MLDYNQEYTISEAADITGYAPHVLRYYEKEFNIDVPRTDSNHRYYTYKEIELLQYIKSLQEKGFNNKQINLIINSPEEIVSNGESNSLSVVDKDKNYNLDTTSIALEISEALEDRFLEKLSEYLSMENKNTEELILSLREEIAALKNEINSKERDILICENAKLKMKVKEKSYEIVKLKEDLRRMENQNQGFFKKLFKSKKNNSK